MKSYLRSALVLMTVGAFAPAALAQVPSQFSPRYFGDQQTTYTRFAVNFNSCPLAVGALSCSFKVGAIPYNSFIVRGYLQVYAAFTGATTMLAGLGTASGTQNLVAGTTVAAVGNAAALTIVPASLGTGNPGVTGNGATQTGGNGGFDLWVTLTATVAAPTAGNAVMILEYILPNDGACAAVPMGSTAPGC